MPNYYLTDLDGTLLRSDATLSQAALKALQTVVEQGAVIGYATARSLQSSWKIVHEAPWNSPIVLYNGALLYDVRKQQVLDGRHLDAVSAETLLDLGRRFGLTPYIFLLDAEGTERVDHEPLSRPAMQAFRASRPGDPRFRELARLTIRPDDRVLMLTYIGAQAELEPLEREAERMFGTKINIHAMKDLYLDAWFLEFSHPEANKAEGLRLWSRHIGCEPSDVTVFGDQLNDVGLFTAAGYRVAPANAHPRLLALADHIALSNDEDGVAAYLLQSAGNGLNTRQA